MSTIQRDDQPAGDAQGPTVPRMLVGIELHRFREAAGITPEQAAYEIRASRSKISRMENGLVRFKERDVTDLLTLYGITDETDAVQAGDAGPAGQHPGLVVASTATSWPTGSSRTWAWRRPPPSSVPSSCSSCTGCSRPRTTPARSPCSATRPRPTDEIDRRVSLRLKRQDLLASPQPPQVWSVLDEGALRRPVGGPEVMRAQLNHLTEMARLRHVTIQVVPFDRGGHAAAGGSFTVLRFSEQEVPDVVYLEHLTSALYLDKRDDVDHYMEVMNHLSTEALTPVQSARFITDMSQDM